MPILSKKYALADAGQCVSCGACRKECPKDAIRIQRGCYAVIDAEVCVGCGKCAGVCPAGCIALKERTEIK